MRLLLIPLSGIVTVSTAHLITNRFGVEEFANLSIILALSALLSFAELGLGAVILNSIQNDDSKNHDYSNTFFKSFFLISAFSLSLVALIIILTKFDLIRNLLNLKSSGISSNAVALSLVFLVAGVPFRLGYYLLIANHKSPTVLLLQMLPSIVTLVLVVLLSSHRGSFSTLVIFCNIGNTIASCLSFFWARRFIPKFASYRQSKSQKLFQTSFPFFLVTLFSIVPLRGAPIILSWTASSLQVAQFAVMLTFLIPALSVIQYAAPQLWVEFRRIRHDGLSTSILLKNSLLICFGLGVVGALALILLAPRVLQGFITPALVGSNYLYYAFGLFFVVLAVNYPLGMYFSDQSGLRLQALLTGLTAFTFIPAGIIFSQRFGSVGMVITLLVNLLIMQVIPGLLVAKKKPR